MQKARYHEVIMSAQSVDDTTSTVIGPALASSATYHTFYVEFGTGVTSGVVEIETASHEAYTGTWDNLATVTFAGTAPNTQIAQIEGTFGALRARITTVIAGGTVSVTYFSI